MGARALENVDTAAFGWVPTYLYMNTGGVHVESAQYGTKGTTNLPNFSEQDTKLKLGATHSSLGETEPVACGCNARAAMLMARRD